MTVKEATGKITETPQFRSFKDKIERIKREERELQENLLATLENIIIGRKCTIRQGRNFILIEIQEVVFLNENICTIRDKSGVLYVSLAL